jgi:hypothetical protein
MILELIGLLRAHRLMGLLTVSDLCQIHIILLPGNGLHILVHFDYSVAAILVDMYYFSAFSAMRRWYASSTEGKSIYF